MHGMICKGLETFLRERNGDAVWHDIRRAAALEVETFEALMTYPDDSLDRMMEAAAARLDCDPEAFLDDFGNWICTSPRLEAVRRLIRFSGSTYEHLIWSLDELHDRAELALPGLDLARCAVDEPQPGQFAVRVSWHVAGAAHILAGVMRAMADDYGVLAIGDVQATRVPGPDNVEWLTLTLVDTGFSAPRDFSMAKAAS